MYKKSRILIVSFLILSCGEKNNKQHTSSDEQTKNELAIALKKTETNSMLENVQEKPINENVVPADCKCYNGIGSSENDEPAVTFAFSNGKSVSICGYKNPDSKPNELLISEFNVFDCLDGKKLVEYGALDNCLIETGNDAMKIHLLKNLPVGENWEWSSVKVAKQLILPHEEELVVSEVSPSYSPIEISESRINAFLDEFKVGQGVDEDWEEVIGRLEVLSLNGNKRAWGLLEDYQGFTGEFFDGALAETWKEALATVRLNQNK